MMSSDSRFIISFGDGDGSNQCHVGIVESIGVLGSLKLSIRRDNITEDILAC